MPTGLPALVLTLVVLMAGHASACSISRQLTDEEQFHNASAVFVAHVIQTEELSANPRGGAQMQDPAVEGTFRVIEVLKGAPPKDGKVRDFVFGPGNCSLGLLAGRDYLFFLHGNNWVLWPGGSKPFIDLQSAECQLSLERLRKLKAASGK
jgi:hypothetical protein